MARYFFHLMNGSYLPDMEGTELPDIAAARIQAVVFAGSILKDHPEKVWDGSELRVVVKDDRGMALFIVTAFVTDSEVAERELPP